MASNKKRKKGPASGTHSAASVPAAESKVERPSVLALADVVEEPKPGVVPFAPYAFVPFHAKQAGQVGMRPTAKVLLRYENSEKLPPHDVIDPELKTGEIHVTLTAETPVFVSDGNNHFYTGANGKFMIPGSTIRGMVRENMQILGFGAVQVDEDIDNKRLIFRDMTAGSDTVAVTRKKYYNAVLDVETKTGKNGKSYTIAKNVKAGYLRRDAQGQFTIQPVKGNVAIRVPQKNDALRAAGLVDNIATTVPVVYRVAEGVVTYISKDIKGNHGKSETLRGVLLYTGRGVKNANARYLFPEADEDAAPVAISKEDIIAYKDDYKARENTLAQRLPGQTVPNPETKKFWALQKEEDRVGKPVFYQEVNGHTWFGMSMFLRIGYPHRVGEGLPVLPSTIKEGCAPLDYPHAVLGYIGATSYRSRVAFGDFAAKGNPQEGPEVRVILGEPRASWLPGYLLDRKNYSDDDFVLAGWKQYWLKEPTLPEVKGSNDKVFSVLKPLPKGTQFSGVIRYKNLHEDELGLLLWALRLEEGCKQTIGMGKPYGYGRMRLEIENLREYNVRAIYSPDGICGHPDVAPKKRIAEYIDKYDAYAYAALGQKNASKMLVANEELQDFFFIHTVIRNAENVGYMQDLKLFNKSSKNLTPIREVREEFQKKADELAKAAEIANLEEEGFAAYLARKLNGGVS